MEGLEKLSFEEKVKAAKAVDSLIAEMEAQIESCKQTIAECTPDRDAIYASLLEDVKSKGVKDYDEQVDDLFVTLFSKEDVAWLDDAGLLKKLQENGDYGFIKTTTKITTSVDKNALKKAFKSNESLKEAYKDFYGTKLTEYVTVTTEENHAKMLEHISENTKKGK